MKGPIAATGLIIGLLAAVWMFVMGFTGWYKDPAKLNLFFLVVVIELAGLAAGLTATAAQGRTYSGQVAAGTLASIVAGIVIFFSSLVFTTVAFPEYFREVNATSRAMMAREGRSEAEIEQVLRDAAPMQTPVRNALLGFTGTFVVGVFSTAVIAVWIRARSTAGVSTLTDSRRLGR
jgi:hypothetical protein